jgi:hypothetical protein
METIELKNLLNNHPEVTQLMIAEEWGNIRGITKTQPRVSAELKKKYTDSESFIQSIYNLCKVERKVPDTNEARLTLTKKIIPETTLSDQNDIDKVLFRISQLDNRISELEFELYKMKSKQ